MPTNSAEYQKQYRKTYNKKHKNITVSLQLNEHAELHEYITKHFPVSENIKKMTFSTLLREATLFQIRGSSLRTQAIEEELKQLKFLLTDCANNLHQIAHHHVETKHALDNDALSILLQLEQTVHNFVNSRLKD